MRAIEWTCLARADLLAIVDYISDDNPDAAQRVKEDIEAKVAKLPDFPQLYRNGRIQGTREMLARANRNGRTQSPNRQGASRSNPPQRAHGLSHGPPFGIADRQASPLPSGAWRREPERGPAPHSLISNFGSSRTGSCSVPSSSRC